MRLTVLRRAIVSQVLVLAGAGLLSTACSWPPGLVSSSSSRPDMAVLAGAWQPTPESLSAVAMTHTPSRPGRLTLQVDGAATFDEVPDFFSAGRGTPVGTLTGAGRWSVAENREWQAWVVSISTSAAGSRLYITGTAPNFELVAVIGDPDRRLALTFSRLSSSAGPN